MKDQRWGIEIEMSGLTRQKAAEVTAEYFGTTATYDGGFYSAWSVLDTQGRKWKFVSDGSIHIHSKRPGLPAEAVELVSPICTYDDIPVVQDIVRKLRAAHAVSDQSCGIHIHVDASPHNANSLTRFRALSRLVTSTYAR